MSASKKEIVRALREGMKAGYELGYDAALLLLEAMETSGDGEPGWSTELRKLRAAKVAAAVVSIEALTGK